MLEKISHMFILNNTLYVLLRSLIFFNFRFHLGSLADQRKHSFLWTVCVCLCVYSFFTSSQQGPSSGTTKMGAWTPMKPNMRSVTERTKKRELSLVSILNSTCWHFISCFQGKKAELKSFVIQLSEEFSILSQFTSFVAIEERVCVILASTSSFILLSSSHDAQQQLKPPTTVGCVLGLGTTWRIHWHLQVGRRGRCGPAPLYELGFSRGTKGKSCGRVAYLIFLSRWWWRRRRILWEYHSGLSLTGLSFGL